jgi:tRNA-dihydrouridine synthase A
VRDPTRYTLAPVDSLNGSDDVYDNTAMAPERPGTAVVGHPRRFCVAPMMDQTDRHCRAFFRSLSAHAYLYTEMVNARAVLRGCRERLLGFAAAEHPVALQLGGSEPAVMASAARIGEQLGYREININAGCPSDRVQEGRFGACLMAQPELVARCVEAMAAAVSLPITVKTRIGIDHQDDYASLHRFVHTVAGAGCRCIIVHARKAWLSGLSPKQNREIPPLRHDVVYRLKRDFPQVEIVINGGITDLAGCRQHLRKVDGVMLGRAPYRNPYLLATVDAELFGADDVRISREEAVLAMVDYAAGQLRQGTPLKHITRHMLGLFQGQPGARRWRRTLSERAHRPGAGVEVLQAALHERLRAAETTEVGGSLRQAARELP